MLWDDYLMGRTAALRTGRGGAGGFVPGVPPEPPPPDPSPVPPGTIVGYAGTAGVSGGGASPTVTIQSNLNGAWSQLKAALLSSGTRYIKIIGSGIIDANGEAVTVRNGNITIDGDEWNKSLKGCGNLVFKDANNVILRYLRLAPGDHTPSAPDWSPVKFNSCEGIAIDHCDLRFGADVSLGMLYHTADVTVQYTLIGPPLYNSHVSTSPNGYGPNVTTPGNEPNPQSVFGERFTFYRNFVAYCAARSMRAHGTKGIEWVNNAYYNHGHDLAHMNIQGGNIVGNMAKQGPQTTTDRFFRSETNAQYGTYFPQSVYRDDNIGIDYSPTWSFASGVERGSPYGGGLHNVSATAASESLFNAVVAAAGHHSNDAVSTAVKAHALAGTSDGWYQGIGFGAVQPTW